MHPTHAARHRQDIAGAWARRALELARWVIAYLLVRTDAYGGHGADGGRTTVHNAATRAVLRRHFEAADAADIIGIHVSSRRERCRAVVVDIDAHGDDDDPERNLRYAMRVYRRARKLGFDVRLLDSNGKGGYHILIVFSKRVPLAVAWRLGKFLVRDHAQYGFEFPPETFPKSAQLTGKRYGGWVRLPGRHHKRDHWTRVWSPRRKRWLEGDDAIDSLLRLRGHDIDPADVIPADFEPAPRRSHAGRVVDEPRLSGCEHRRNLRLARAALRHLGPDYRDPYDRWLLVGMALRQLGPDGLDLWEQWSRPSPRYEVGATAEKWASFSTGSTTGGLTLGSLFHLAEREGWDRYDIDEDDAETGIVRRRHISGKTGTIDIPIKRTGAREEQSNGAQKRQRPRRRR